MARQIQVIPARRELTNRAAPSVKKIRLAPYCRVSTDEEDQLQSFENQQRHYLDYVHTNPRYELVRIYADEGITGTNTRKRDDFNRMIADCEAGLIDMVITKSISRFSRNTADCLTYSRKLRDMGIGILFEKEGINTIESSGELLFTILSSLAQDESRNISENTTWGIRSRFKQGKMHINTNRFLGYDKGKDGRLVINPEQAAIVRRIYDEFLDGNSPDVICAGLKADGVLGVTGGVRWSSSTIYHILQNEKYKGDALLQKYIIPDFLTGRFMKNDGSVEQYYVKGSHEAIIEPERWELVQLELKRRDDYRQRYGLRTMGRYSNDQPFSNRVFCGECGNPFWRRTWYRLAGEVKIWSCMDRFSKDGKRGCAESIILRERDLHRGFVKAWNELVSNRSTYLLHWHAQLESEKPLARFYAKRFMRLTETQTPMIDIDLAIVNKTLEHVVVKRTGTLIFHFLDGSKVNVEPET